jgi:hypothetical protein
MEDKEPKLDEFVLNLFKIQLLYNPGSYMATDSALPLVFDSLLFTS